MFSITITASSTTRPTASDSPSSVNVLSVQSQEVQHRDRAEQRHRDREQHVERRRQRAEEQPAHDRGQDHREHELEADLVDRLLDEAGGVEQHLDLHARRQRASGSRRTPCAPPSRPTTAFEPGCLRMPIAWTGGPFMRAFCVTSSKPSWTSATSPSRVIERAGLLDHDVAQRLRGRRPRRARGCRSPSGRSSSGRPTTSRAACVQRAA